MHSRSFKLWHSIFRTFVLSEGKVKLKVLKQSKSMGGLAFSNLENYFASQVEPILNWIQVDNKTKWKCIVKELERKRKEKKSKEKRKGDK